MKIYFIRHGETTGDVENRYGGAYDDHLSEKGQQQAKALADTLKAKSIEVIFSSPLIRAQETAQFLSDLIQCDVILAPDVRERNQYGILSGMEKSAARDNYPDMIEKLKDRMNTIEGAESYENFTRRFSEWLRKLLNNPQYGTVAIVTHGGSLRILFREILQWGELKEIGDCCYIELEYIDQTFIYREANGLMGIFKIVYLISHY